jgi:hypothetical protein
MPGLTVLNTAVKLRSEKLSYKNQCRPERVTSPEPTAKRSQNLTDSGDRAFANRGHPLSDSVESKVSVGVNACAPGAYAIRPYIDGDGATPLIRHYERTFWRFYFLEFPDSINMTRNRVSRPDWLLIISIWVKKPGF